PAGQGDLMSLIYDALRQSAPTGAGAAASASSAHRPSMHWWRRPLPWLVAGMLVAGPLGFLIARQGAPAAREATAPVAPVAPVAAGAATAAASPAPAAEPMATDASRSIAPDPSPASAALPDAVPGQAPMPAVVPGPQDAPAP